MKTYEQFLRNIFHFLREGTFLFERGGRRDSNEAFVFLIRK